MSFSKQDAVNYRFERALETIEEAEILAYKDHWNTVANRLYYACFYATIGILLQDGHLTKSHSGAKELLNRFYVKEGKLEKGLGKLYAELFNKRQEADYKDIKRFSKEEVEPLILQVKVFVDAMAKLIVKA